MEDVKVLQCLYTLHLFTPPFHCDSAQSTASHKVIVITDIFSIFMFAIVSIDAVQMLSVR